MAVLYGWINVAVLLINVIAISGINELILLRTLAQGTTEFVSVDCGSSDKSNYTNSLTGPDIIWTPDTTLWPDIEEWSASFDNMNLPTNMTDEKQYSTLRYFPTNKALNQSKFCYTLRVIADNYYLIRASFWFGPLSMIYETHKDDQIRFHMIVDNYEGVEIVIDIPQKYPWFEEMTTVSALQDLFPTFRHFLGDPCLPQGYKYLWIECDYSNPQNPARVTSIALSNYSLEGNLPSSISNLDQLVKLDLSNNSLSGPIPPSLSNLQKLSYLNLANNNFSGTVPETLLQKQSSGLLHFSYDGNSFLCITSNDTCGSSPSSSSKHKKFMIGFIIGGVLLFIIVILAILCFFCRGKTPTNDNVDEIKLVQSQTPTHPTPFEHRHPSVNINTEELNNATKVAQQFTFQVIRIATNNFSTVLGEGGFGPVYKGNLPNGLEVAVKILSSTSTQGPQQFLNEVTLLSRVHHKNLVGFEGYCTEKSLVLVYEFMRNGSLHDALSRRKATQTLTWRERLQILSDAAQGLAYLHHGCNIIHRDVKSSNILLSKNLEGKMSDFGISKLKSLDSDNLTTRLVGTFGYLDPQYASTLQLTQKIDIFSFGVVLLEALCGLPPILKDPETENGDIHIVEWVRPAYERGIIENIVDERLENNYNLSSIWKVVEIAMTCVQFEGAKRPTMNVVCNDLSEAIGMECSHESSPWTTTEVSSIYSHVQVR